MNHMLESEPVLLCGRKFTFQELEDIRETVRMFPSLSRKELAYTICEHLEWVSPNGRYKVEACGQLLEKLDARGVLELPEIRKYTPSEQLVIPEARTEAEAELVGIVSEFEPIEIEAVRKSDDIHLWNEYIQRYHILRYKRPFGAHQRYFIVSRVQGGYRRLGCLLFAASAWALADRDHWIGWNEADRSQRLNLIVNNTRFLIFPWVKVKNLASKALSLAVRQVPIDWQERYGFTPVLLETFVDIAQYQGTCYKAANWMLLGETSGRGRMDRYTQYLSSTKHIYVYAVFEELTEMPHQDTLCRLLEKIEVDRIESLYLDMLRKLIRRKKFRNLLHHKKYLVAVDGTEKQIMDECWDERYLRRKIKGNMAGAAANIPVGQRDRV